MKSGKIEVVRHEGELLFKCDGILLDILRADDFGYTEFVGISVFRGGQLLDKGYVHDIGDQMHNWRPCFGELFEVSKEFYCGMNRSFELYPDYFREKDEIHFQLFDEYGGALDYRRKYAVEETSKKFAERYDLLFEFVNDEKFEEAHKELETLFAQEVDSFVFPEHPILRRKKERQA